MPEQRKQIDTDLSAKIQRMTSEIFADIPEVTSISCVISWSFPQQDGMPTGIITRPTNSPIHAGERLKILRNLTKLAELIAQQLQEEFTSLSQYGDKLGKAIQQLQIVKAGLESDVAGLRNPTADKRGIKLQGITTEETAASPVVASNASPG